MTITKTPMKNNSDTRSLDCSQTESEYQTWREEVADRLDEQKYFDEAERWSFCHDTPRHVINRNNPVLPDNAKTVWVCSDSIDHDSVVFVPTCGYRVCPDCAPRQTARLVKRYFPVIEKELQKNNHYRLRRITLTCKIKLGDAGFKEAAQNGFNLIQKCMRKVVGENWNKLGAGLLANWEVGEDGHKLHYHIIYLGNWVDWQKLRDAWYDLTGDSYIVYVQAVLHNETDWQSAVMETLKYSTKFSKTDKTTGKRTYLSPELTVELFMALKGTRRIRTYGCFYGIDAEESEEFSCSECSAPMIRIGVEHWQVWFETGFSPLEWSKLIREARLYLKLANKSPPKPEKTDNKSQFQTPILPGMEEIMLSQKPHYAYE